MYKVETLIKGNVPLLQNRFTATELEGLGKGLTKTVGKADYSLEWMEKMYATHDGLLYQPGDHIEGSLVKSATTFKIKGRGNKTWKDPIRAYCYVVPDEIPHLRDGKPVRAPDADLLNNPGPDLKVDVRRVKVQRAAVARSRLMVGPGWELRFIIEVHDEQVRSEVLHEILSEAGRAVGIGDFRPKYGRFEVVEFDVLNGSS